jgi:hypothetical protein
VGKSGEGRKGVSGNRARSILRQLDESWVKKCLVSGLSTGEGLIWQVRDPIEKMEPLSEKGVVVGYEPVIVDHGAADKRLLVTEPEFVRPLKAAHGDRNTLSALIREAWDGRDLRSLTKTCPATATEAHISIIGHITVEELLKHLTRSDVANGLANRFLFVMVHRTKHLPDGGQAVHLDDIIERLKRVVEFARGVGEMRRDGEAAKLWEPAYSRLTQGRPGLCGAVCGRAEAQVLRLCLLYSLLDLSPVVRREHLTAALALGNYSEQSARHIFAESSGDPIAEKILSLVRDRPGISRTEIYHAFQRHIDAHVLVGALANSKTRG